MEMILNCSSSISPASSLRNLLLPQRCIKTLTFTPKTFHYSSDKSLTVAGSLLDDAAAAPAPALVKVVENNPFLAAKKKATDISLDLKGTSIYLIGVSSSVKTRLGKLLADAFRYYFFDSDSLIEEAAGGEPSTKSLLERDEKGFREAETEVLEQLSAMGRLVVSAGNGAVQSSTNLALLRHGISIWIDVPLDMVARQISENGIQLPGLDISTASYSEVFTRLTQLYEEAKSGYSTADAKVSLWKVASELGHEELEAVSMEDMCLEVIKEIEKLMRVKKLMEDAARPF